MAQKTFTKESFNSFVKDAILEYLPDDWETRISSVDKPGRSYVGVSASPRGTNISPTIDTEPFYKKYLDEECLDDILKDIAGTLVKAFRSNPITSEIGDFMEFLKDYDRVKERLMIKLLPKDAVPKDWVSVDEAEDIAIVPYIFIKSDRNGFAATAVVDKMLDMWGLSSDTVIEVAYNNADEVMPVKVMSMFEKILELTGCDAPEPDPSMDMMLIVSNEKHTGGAACIFYPGVADSIYERVGRDYYILPSSRDEVIVVPCMGPVDDLKEMVVTTNQETVGPEAFLSNSVYRYRHEDRKIVKEA